MANQKVSVEKLAADEHFQQWVLAPTPRSDQYWKQWVEKYPDYKPVVNEARQLLLNLHLEDEQTPSGLQQEIWVKVRPVFNQKDQTPFYHWSLRKRVSIAASLTVMVVASIFFLTYYLSTTTNYQTAYGETKEITLPDGSTVMLNANSSIRFGSDWKSAEVREVWLEGEAFFDVRQIPLSKDGNVRLPFIVHSQNMDVEVLGTTFNVKDRQEYSEVILNTGKVNVTPRLKQESAPIAMNPGDQLAYSVSEQEWKIQQINPEIPTAWRHQELIFDEMPLGEIARLLEEVYGYNISFETEEIKLYVFTGNIKTDEVEVLLPMLERSFDLKVYQDSKTIRFSRK